MTGKVDLALYRPNVGVALFSRKGRVFFGRRVGERGAYSWQMPQGGVDDDEELADAALRELEEETGVRPRQVEPLGGLSEWLIYDFPPEVRANKKRKGQSWHGQRQRWFAYRFIGKDSDIDLEAHKPPEFDAWRWEELARTPDLVIPWKRPVYAAVARAFAKHADGR